MDGTQVGTGAGAVERADASFIGRGFSWPLEIDHTGSLRLTRGAEDLDRSIRVVLLTAPGERLMRPQFGCRIWDLLSEAVRDALAQWEPRVEVEAVEPVQDGEEPGLVRIQITYRVRATNDRRNLVYPFYVIPREDR
jgi:phage baseplate assembly protein W